jgi:hypothetical protein
VIISPERILLAFAEIKQRGKGWLAHTKNELHKTTEKYYWDMINNI